MNKPASLFSPIPKGHVPVLPAKTGVLLVNLGTPDGTGYFQLRRYLAEFLSDPRVIELPRWKWLPILHGIILTIRPFKIAHAYKSVWRTDTNEGPLLAITRQQAEGLQGKFGKDVLVDFAMRYGNPSIASKLEGLYAAGCRQVLIVPMYPQYSAATTGTVCDKVFESLQHTRWVRPVRIARPYYDNPHHISALAASTAAHVAKLGWEPQVVVASFHGMPQRYVQNGDVYYCHCHKTARLLAESLGWFFVADHTKQPIPKSSKPVLVLSYQSRFGPEAWLQPYTDETLVTLAKNGITNVAVTTPGFAADCLETLEEIAMQGRDSFMAAGGQNYAHIPCLNATPTGVHMLEQMIRDELAGWVSA
ncbi:MAG: ferrochelatase [Alphaproteobacteria bacterium]